MSRRRLPLAAVICFAGGSLVMLLEAPVAPIVAVPLIFAAVALGVAAIATPEFLESDRDEPG